MVQSLVLVGLVAVAWLSGLIVHLLWPVGTWVNVPLHSTVEALGGLGAVLMAVVLSARKDEWNGQIRWIATGFLGMGLLEIFHALSPPGNGFVLLRCSASLLGGLGFSLAWLPADKNRRFGWPLILPTVVAGTAAFALGILVYPERLPRHDGEWGIRIRRRGDEQSGRLALHHRCGSLFERFPTVGKTGELSLSLSRAPVRGSRDHVSHFRPVGR